MDYFNYQQDFKGRNNEVRAVRVKISTGYWDRPIQLLYSSELHCNDYKNDLKCQDKEKINHSQQQPDQGRKLPQSPQSKSKML